MHLKFDIDQRSLVKAVDGSSVKSAKIAYPDKYPLKIDFYRGEQAFSFTGQLKATVKPVNQQLSSALAVMVAPISASSSVEGILDLATVPLKTFVRDFGQRPVALELLVLNANGAEIASWTVNCEISRRYTGTEDVAEDLPDMKATKLEAEEGTNNSKWMTPLRTRQALEAVGIEVMGV